MFDRIFSYFQKPLSEEANEEDLYDDAIASITYFIKRDTKGALIDVQIDDYNDESIEALGNLLDVLGNDSAYLDTINMIKTSLINEHQEEVLIKLISKIGLHIKNKMVQSYENHNYIDEPCIKPSDML